MDKTNPFRRAYEARRSKKILWGYPSKAEWEGNEEWGM